MGPRRRSDVAPVNSTYKRPKRNTLTVADKIERAKELCEIRGHFMDVRRELVKIGQETEIAVMTMEQGVADVQAMKLAVETEKEGSSKAMEIMQSDIDAMKQELTGMKVLKDDFCSQTKTTEQTILAMQSDVAAAKQNCMATEAEMKQTKDQMFTFLKQLQQQTSQCAEAASRMAQVTDIEKRYEQLLTTSREVNQKQQSEIETLRSWIEELKNRDIKKNKEAAVQTIPLNFKRCDTQDGFIPVDQLTRMYDVRMACYLYLCFGGAPNLSFEWTDWFGALRDEDSVSIMRISRFQRRYPVLRSFDLHLTQFIIQAIGTHSSAHYRLNHDALSASGKPIEKLDRTALRGELDKVVWRARRLWAKALIHKINKLLKSLPPWSPDIDNCPAKEVDMRLSICPLLEPPEHGVAYAGCLWHSSQSDAMWHVVRHIRYTEAKFMPSYYTGVSAGALLFLLLFDVTKLADGYKGIYQLTRFGADLIAHLWNRLSTHILSAFDESCSWLQSQRKQSGIIPPLGFCHVVVSVLIWNQFSDKGNVLDDDFYIDAIRNFLNALHVNGVHMHEPNNTVENLSLLDESTRIELIGLDPDWFEIAFRLSGFFDMAKEIQKHLDNTAAVK